MSRSRRNRKKTAIDGPFAARPVALLESPAYRVLSLAAHQILSRLEVENGAHAGTENGSLKCTFADFARYGLHHRQIAPAIRELEALGLIQTMVRGVGGNREFRQASEYRITFRHAKGDIAGDGSHEWRRITTIEQAEALAREARKAADPLKVARSKNRISGAESVPVLGPETDPESTPFSGAESDPRVRVQKVHPLSRISVTTPEHAQTVDSASERSESAASRARSPSASSRTKLTPDEEQRLQDYEAEQRAVERDFADADGPDEADEIDDDPLGSAIYED